jgi:hypothetical protein
MTTVSLEIGQFAVEWSINKQLQQAVQQWSVWRAIQISRAAQCKRVHARQCLKSVYLKWKCSYGVSLRPTGITEARSRIRRWRLKALELIIQHDNDDRQYRPQMHHASECMSMRPLGSSRVEYGEHWCPFYPGYRAGDQMCKFYRMQALLARYRAAASALSKLGLKLRVAWVRQKIYEWDHKIEKHQLQYTISEWG